MPSANINIRVDAELKRAAEALFADLGLNMSTAVTMFLRSAVRQDGIPFEVTRSLPNTVTRKALSEYEQMRQDPESYPRYDSFDALLEDTVDA